MARGGRSNAEWMALVHSGDFSREPTLELTQREDGAFFKLVAISSFSVAESRAWKDMNGSHHGADQPLNTTAKTWSRRRAIDELDPIFAARRFQCFRVKFRPVVAMQDRR